MKKKRDSLMGSYNLNKTYFLINVDIYNSFGNYNFVTLMWNGVNLSDTFTTSFARIMLMPK